VRENDAENWTVGSDRQTVDDGVDRIAQKFKARNERDVEFA
jgi:hypothetical protein